MQLNAKREPIDHELRRSSASLLQPSNKELCPLWSSADIEAWQMTVGNQHGDFTEIRIYPDAAIHVVRPADFDARRAF